MVKFSSFSVLDREFRNCFTAVSRVRLTSEMPVRYHRDTSEIFAGS